MCGPTGIQTLKAAASNRAAWLASGEPAGKQPIDSSRSSSSSSSSHRVIFPRRKSGESQHSAGPVRVTRQMLESLTHLSLPNACTKLGLCATTFKKACRREGIMQWPYKRGCALALEEEERRSAAKACNAACNAANAISAIVVNSIIIEESSFTTSSLHYEVDCTSTSSSSPDESSDAAFSLCTSSPSTTSSSSSSPTYTLAPSYPSSPCSSSTSEEENINTEEDAGAKDFHFLEQDFFGGDLDLSCFRDAAMFDEEDAAFLRMTGWDAPI